MKKILTALILLCLMLSLSACGESGRITDSMSGGSAADTESSVIPDVSVSDSSDTSASTDTVVSSDGSSATATDSESTASSEKEEVKGFDETMEHKFLACDVTNGSIVVFDLNACEGDFQKLTDDDISVVWEFGTADDPECNLLKSKRHIDSAKYRYSPYYECDVIIACGSNGWAAVIAYEEKELLWEYKVGNGPHSIEMLPNGDVVVACSSNPGALTYVPLSAGIEEPVSSIPSLYCHGVSWDPDNELLWVLEDNGVYAATIRNMGTEDGEIVRVSGSGCLFDNGEAGGHAFSPVYGEPGKYWASSGSKLWKFDSETEELTSTFDRAKNLTAMHMKGIASFPDGTVVQTIANIGGECTWGWSCDGLRVITREVSSGKVKVLQDKVTDVIFDTNFREFYKVQPFTKDYR